MTPREFILYNEMIIEEKIKENEQIDYRLAVLLSHMTNLKIPKKSKHTKPEDFIKKRKNIEQKHKKPMKSEVMAEILKGFTLACGGKVV
jgi:hypothetical protein